MLLSMTYRSSEAALKELIDNAWDADATLVNILLPEPMTDQPIIIEDNGIGMTEAELREEYLFIANNRRAQRGNLTKKLKRQVKGRKGVGKFAGLLAASKMRIETCSNGKRSELEFDKDALQQFSELSDIPININVVDDSSHQTGTRIILTGLLHNLKFPSPNKLKQLLIQEYGRSTGFTIKIDNKILDIDDIQGKYTDIKPLIKGVGEVKLRFTISDQKKDMRNPGIVIRVGGKVVGEPTFFGLDKDDSFPEKLLNKCYGEVEVDGLLDDVTADWGAIIENSEKLQALEQALKPILYQKFNEIYGKEINSAHAHIQNRIKARLAKLPEYKRQFAEEAIKKILEKFYKEPQDKIDPIVNVMLDAIEFDYYRKVLHHIDSSEKTEVFAFAEALNLFGMYEMSKMVEQANNRIQFLDKLEKLCSTQDTVEAILHKAIEKSLWIIGPKYTLFSSNTTLKNQIEKFLDKKYTGKNANKRPDLMLSENMDGSYLLIEFKRPSHSLVHKDYQQATSYRNEFRTHSLNENIEVLIIGGAKGRDLPSHKDIEQNVRFVTYKDVISTARRQLEWLLSNELT